MFVLPGAFHGLRSITIRPEGLGDCVGSQTPCQQGENSPVTVKYSLLIICVLGLVSVIGFSLVELTARRQKSRRFGRTI